MNRRIGVIAALFAACGVMALPLAAAGAVPGRSLSDVQRKVDQIKQRARAITRKRGLRPRTGSAVPHSPSSGATGHSRSASPKARPHAARAHSSSAGHAGTAGGTAPVASGGSRSSSSAPPSSPAAKAASAGPGGSGGGVASAAGDPSKAGGHTAPVAADDIQKGDPKTLPFTGFGITPLLVVGLLALLGGLAVRRSVSRT
jgi:hypothetical protein